MLDFILIVKRYKKILYKFLVSFSFFMLIRAILEWSYGLFSFITLVYVYAYVLLISLTVYLLVCVLCFYSSAIFSIIMLLLKIIKPKIINMYTRFVKNTLISFFKELLNFKKKWKVLNIKESYIYKYIKNIWFK